MARPADWADGATLLTQLTKFNQVNQDYIGRSDSDGYSAIAEGQDNDQTGTTYTLVLTDADLTTVWMNNASANTVTIPTNASVAFPVGTKIVIAQEGAGATTITGDTGVTVNGTSGGSVAVGAQYQAKAICKRATDTWIVL